MSKEQVVELLELLREIVSTLARIEDRIESRTR